MELTEKKEVMTKENHKAMIIHEAKILYRESFHVCLYCKELSSSRLCGRCYGRVHAWAKKRIAKPKDNICPKCKLSSNFWKQLELSNNSNEYLYDENDFEWICNKCHGDKDAQSKADFAFKARLRRKADYLFFNADELAEAYFDEANRKTRTI